MLRHDYIRALFVQSMYVFLGKFNYGINQTLLLSEQTLELMTIQFMFQFIVNKSLAHKFANNDFNFGPLLKKTVILTNLDLVVLDQFKKMSFVCTFFSYGAICIM